MVNLYFLLIVIGYVLFINIIGLLASTLKLKGINYVGRVISTVVMVASFVASVWLVTQVVNNENDINYNVAVNNYRDEVVSMIKSADIKSIEDLTVVSTNNMSIYLVDEKTNKVEYSIPYTEATIRMFKADDKTMINNSNICDKVSYSDIENLKFPEPLDIVTNFHSKR